jgi:hypothetical protein
VSRARCLLFGVAIRRRPICRTGTRIGRHSAGYLGTERGTITNINIQRPRSLWWYGVSRQLRPLAKNLASLQHPPCRSAKRTHSVSSSCPRPPFSLSLPALLCISLSLFIPASPAFSNLLQSCSLCSRRLTRSLAPSQGFRLDLDQGTLVIIFLRTSATLLDR